MNNIFRLSIPRSSGLTLSNLKQRITSTARIRTIVSSTEIIMAACNLAALFDTEGFCDVTISFGARTIKAHKVILYVQLDYFRTLCGPESSFAESAQGIIELKDDNSDAVAAMLAWLYGKSYESAKPADDNSATFAHEVYVVADKYGLALLKEEAFKVLKNGICYGSIEESLPLVVKHYDGTLHSTITDLMESKCKQSFKHLVQLDEFKDILKEHPAQAMDLIRRMANSSDSGTIEMTLVRYSCGHSRVMTIGTKGPCPLGSCRYCSYYQTTSVSCWMTPQDAATHNA